jgi:hypothetical protein
MGWSGDGNRGDPVPTEGWRSLWGLKPPVIITLFCCAGIAVIVLASWIVNGVLMLDVLVFAAVLGLMSLVVSWLHDRRRKVEP